MSLTKLEDEIGKLLFVREGRQMTLTENGRKLLKYADIVGQAIACILIADEKYMNTAIYKGVERVHLYKQRLLLSVPETSEYAARESIDVAELEDVTMIGRSASKGFNDWLDDVSKENRVNLRTDLHCDYAFYVTEYEKIPGP